MKSITIEIDEEGNTKVEADGYTDGSCRTATEPFEKALGAVEERKMKIGGACAVKERVKA